MPITAVQEAAPTRPRMSAYARVEVIWVAIAIDFALILLVVVPAPLIALRRIIAAVTDSKAGA